MVSTHAYFFYWGPAAVISCLCVSVFGCKCVTNCGAYETFPHRELSCFITCVILCVDVLPYTHISIFLLQKTAVIMRCDIMIIDSAVVGFESGSKNSF